MQSPTFVTEVWSHMMYCQYEVLNFADKLHIQYIPLRCFLFQILQNTHKNNMNDEESDYKA